MFLFALPIILIISFLMALYSLRKELEREKTHQDTTIFASRELKPGSEEFI